MEPTNQHRHFELESDFSALDVLITEADAFARANGADEDLAYRIVLLTTEAATNAIEHGNRNDPSKKIIVDFTRTADRIEVSVEDEGPGFNTNAVKDPLASENLLEEGGRGIFLIGSMADEHAFELDGRRIRMSFRLQPST